MALREKLESCVSAYLRSMPERVELLINIRSSDWSGENVTFIPRMSICERCIIDAKAVLLRSRNQNNISVEVSAKKSLNTSHDNIEVDIES